MIQIKHYKKGGSIYAEDYSYTRYAGYDKNI